ncbi:MAG: MMPL family transporter [Bacteroidia bacterium]
MLLILKPIKNQKKYYLTVLTLVILFTVYCSLIVPKLSFNYNFESFFPNEDNETEIYNNYRKTFEYDNEFALIAIERNKGIFEYNFLNDINNFTTELGKIKNIVKVTSPTNIKHISFGGLIPVQSKILHFNDKSLYKDDSISIYNSSYLIGSFFASNAKSLSIFIKTKDVLTKKESDVLAKQITNCINKYNFENVHYVGRIYAQQVYLSKLQTEFTLFLILSFFIVIIFLWFSFKSLYGIVVPIIIVILSVLFTLGIMQLLGKQIDIMCTMLPTMIFIAGMSDVVHFFTKYFEELAKGTVKDKIYSLILKEVGFPTFLTLITTVVGFLSLLFTSIQPIRDFGIYTSIGVVIAFILSYTLLPALLYFFTPKKLIAVHNENNKSTRIMRNGLFWIFRNQKTIIVSSVIVVLISIFGITKIKTNNILLEDLSEKVKIKQDFNFFDKHFSGVRPLEIAIGVKKNNLLDTTTIQSLNKIENFIKKEYQAGFLISIPAIVKQLNYSLNNIKSDSLPVGNNLLEITNFINQNKKSKELKKIITSDLMLTRISGKIRDEGSLTIGERNKKLLAYYNLTCDTSNITLNITGAAHLMDRNNEYMVENMAQGFGFSLLIIAILTFILHKSWRMVLVFFLPNIFPLIVIAGFMGYAGIELKAATSLVFSIAFGIATDDTIHFISRLKIELEYGKSILYAFKRTYFETGKPIVLTTFILMGGFMSLMLSDFQSTFYFGFLICITVIVAVLADIFLLPALLFLIYKKRK